MLYDVVRLRDCMACRKYKTIELCYLICYLFSAENIALNKPAYQQHPYSGPMPSHLTEASNAVDGLYQNLSVWGGQCVYSDDGQETATLWVNLTRIFNIYLIDIKFMSGNSSWGVFPFLSK